MAVSRNVLQQVQPALCENVRSIERVAEKGRAIHVAAYCRVSTDKDIQKTSLDAQIAAYNKIITEHPGWVLADIYVDEGISGTTVKHREDFKRMIADAEAGKIDYVIAKSISRFARNTEDTLHYVRLLKSYGASVYFEKEKIDTGNAISELLLSILAAAAQEESMSLSNNMKVGRRMRYASGIVQWTHVYGYRKGENGEWQIEESEAEVVRRIFMEYAEGRSLPDICKGLEKDGVPSTGGKDKWFAHSVANLLHNEKYMGDLRMQKTFISDPIQHTKVTNRDAKIKQYYMEAHHDPIVEKETYDIVQMISAMRDTHRGASQYPFYGFLKCPICGQNMVRFSMGRNPLTYGWTCAGKTTKKGDLRKQRSSCPPYYIVERYINKGFWDALRAVNKLSLQELSAEKDSAIASKAERMLELQRLAAYKDKTIEYKMLIDLVDGISFPQWSVMKVDWKCGVTSEAQLEYKKISEQPYPQITRAEVEHTTSKGTKTVLAYIVNGEPVIKGNPEKQIEAMKRSQEDVLNLTILEPLSYEPDVLRVFGTKTCCATADPELAAKNRVKKGLPPARKKKNA